MVNNSIVPYELVLDRFVSEPENHEQDAVARRLCSRVGKRLETPALPHSRVDGATWATTKRALLTTAYRWFAAREAG